MVWAFVPQSVQNALCRGHSDMQGAFAGFGYHGNGVGMGSYAAALLADLARAWHLSALTLKPCALFLSVFRLVPIDAI